VYAGKLGGTTLLWADTVLGFYTGSGWECEALWLVLQVAVDGVVVKDFYCAGGGGGIVKAEDDFTPYA
jgi:hypothetical protein